MAFDWDPEQYGRFGAERLRPAMELLARIEHPDPQLVHDLGTGRGELAQAMAVRWPDARVVGSDHDEAMLEVARTRSDAVEWRRLDVSEWGSEQPVDVLTANAVLHWLPDHESLFPKLVQSLAPGGVLAVQMPLSWHEPSHLLLREVAARHGVSAPQAAPVHAPEWYVDLLLPLADVVDVWVTRYFHVLRGPDAVLEWVRGSALRPVLADADDAAALEAEYATVLRTAYPVRGDGTVVFPFPRLFIVAGRAA